MVEACEFSATASEKNGIYVAFSCKELDNAYECNKILYIGKAWHVYIKRTHVEDFMTDS